MRATSSTTRAARTSSTSALRSPTTSPRACPRAAPAAACTSAPPWPSSRRCSSSAWCSAARSVLTDPDAFPALHDELYERMGTPQATGRGDLSAERARADALIAALHAHAAPGALITTTTDELPLLRARWSDDVLVEQGRLTALVGDRLAHVRTGVGAPSLGD
jgi:hypothetical protein